MKNKFTIALVYIIIFFNSNLFSAENNKILKVGLLVPLSGAYSELGNSILYSLQLALEEINDKKVQILLSRFQEADHSLHPMMHGRIVNLSESGTAKVAVKGGYIFIDEVKKSGRFCKINELIERPGIFHTPILELEKSKNKNTWSKLLFTN